MKHVIEIRTNPPFRPLRALVPFSLQVGVIGIGIATGSAAMQWVGFVMLVLFGLTVATVSAKKNQGLSIAEAHRRLDEIEKENSPAR